MFYLVAACVLLNTCCKLRCTLCEISGQALVESGESYKQMADIKYALEDNVKQNFIEPLRHLQSKDLKEVNVSFGNTAAIKCVTLKLVLRRTAHIP